MSKLRSLALLMGIAILGITGFQAYWLKENYAREKKALTLKSQAAFRETVLELQVSKLKLDNLSADSKDSSNGKVRVYVNEGHDKEVKLMFRPKEKIISTVNVIRDKLRDSLKVRTEIPPGLIISMNNSSTRLDNDSIQLRGHLPPPGVKGDRIFDFLVGVDSLQDSLRISEIDSAFKKRLKEEKIDIPFMISRVNMKAIPDDSAPDEVTVGFANPVTYRLVPGNLVGYLVKRISLPILFSIILIGITILSFVLLYRNMLKQQRLAELKNEFISNITHELKTPIATVGVAIEALKNFNAIDDPARTKEYLDISSNELQRLGFLVDKVLKLSMFEKKEIELKYEPLDIRQLVDEVVESMKLQLEKYEAKVDIIQGGNVRMEGDRLNLLSVVFNLVDNAIKYSKENPRIIIDLKEKENDIELQVIDNGIGIAPEYQEKIFEKFFRVPQGNIHNAKGYGLGLSYAAQVIRKHKGTIRTESKPGEGTRFIISLPKHQNV